MKKILAVLVAFHVFAAFMPQKAMGQNMHVSTNLLDYLNLGTINGEFGLSPWPQWTLYMRGRYNPFSHNFKERMQNRVLGGAVGAKFWFWYSNSGWFLNSHIGYSKYNTGGVFDNYAYEGDAWHITAGGGYALMLSKKFNMEFSLGAQGGYTNYTRFACPRCGKVMGSNKKIYVVPSNIMVQLSMIL